MKTWMKSIAARSAAKITTAFQEKRAFSRAMMITAKRAANTFITKIFQANIYVNMKIMGGIAVKRGLLKSRYENISSTYERAAIKSIWTAWAGIRLINVTTTPMVMTINAASRAPNRLSLKMLFTPYSTLLESKRDSAITVNSNEGRMISASISPPHTFFLVLTWLIGSFMTLGIHSIRSLATIWYPLSAFTKSPAAPLMNAPATAASNGLTP